MVQFVAKARPYIGEFHLTACYRYRCPFNINVVEGINNTIEVIKRRAYGYREEEYIFLKIRAAFAGSLRSTHCVRTRRIYRMRPVEPAARLRSSSMSRLGDIPNSRLYSLLNCEGLS